ncbi:MAG: cysteine desulfurase [Chitinophagales bacterium]|nr:cysteine desulfurase [Chitinophagales bacterium]
MGTIVSTGWNVQAIREDFPILKTLVHNKPLIYFDNAASTQKPKIVLDTEYHYYTTQYSNIHRGVHYLSQIGTDLYEKTRHTIKNFIGAASEKEIIFTKGTTNSINLLAYSWSSAFLKAGDEILITGMEHHSNIVPWQMACQRHGANLKVIPIQEDGSINIEDVKKLISGKTRLLAFTYVSNALGTINPVKDMIDLAHQAGAHVLLDAAQAIQHIPMNVQDLDCDFLAFSGHKIYGPTGTGILYGKEKLLDAIPPFEGGGDMIKDVKFEHTSFNELPFKFEAGTPNIAGIIALGTAIEYVENIGLDKIYAYEDELLQYGTEQLSQIDSLKIYGQSKHKSSVLSFLLGKAHPYDVGVILDHLGIAIRTGHHCTQPIMDYFCIPGTCRASFAFYNTKEEIDALVSGIRRAAKMLL